MLVVTYNILADRYIKPEFYPHTPRECLGAVRRHPALLERIASFDADVLCFQEVEGPLFAAIQARLDGFEGHYEKKAGDKPDGCAVFAKGGVRSRRSLTYRGDSGHVALIVELDFAGRRLGIATTHFKWGPPAASVGIDQATQLLDELPPGLDGWIIGGDFNANPESALAAEFRRRGFVDAYADIGGHTCNSNGVAKRIDYLFHSATLRSAPRPVPAITGETPLPSASEPSDHLALAATFAWA
jgi:mRNA deadenylase 3'-5' endonuclease subunit Ccr4